MPARLSPFRNKVCPPLNDQDLEIGSILAAHCRETLMAAQSMDALRTSEAQYRDLVENMKDAVYTVDTTGIIRYISPAIQQITGFRPADFIGRDYRKFFLAEETSRLTGAYSNSWPGTHESS